VRQDICHFDIIPNQTFYSQIHSSARGSAMLDKLFGGDTFVAATHALDAATLRHEVYSNNLANFNTPGYKRHDVSFENKLSAALATSNQPYGISGTSAVSEVEASVMTVNTTSTRTDGNNVDPEKAVIAGR